MANAAGGAILEEGGARRGRVGRSSLQGRSTHIVTGMLYMAGPRSGAAACTVSPRARRSFRIRPPTRSQCNGAQKGNAEAEAAPQRGGAGGGRPGLAALKPGGVGEQRVAPPPNWRDRKPDYITRLKELNALLAYKPQSKK